MNTRTKAMAAAMAAGLAVMATPFAANAQHRGFLHRHSGLAAVGAGIAAHHMAKRGARGRAASGRRGNFAERHPILSGVAAGAATHHFLKRH